MKYDDIIADTVINTTEDDYNLFINEDDISSTPTNQKYFIKYQINKYLNNFTGIVEVTLEWNKNSINNKRCKVWIENNKIHNEKGYAMVWNDDCRMYSSYFLNDKRIGSKEDFYRQLYELGKISEEEMILEIL